MGLLYFSFYTNRIFVLRIGLHNFYNVPGEYDKLLGILRALSRNDGVVHGEPCPTMADVFMAVGAGRNTDNSVIYHCPTDPLSLGLFSEIICSHCNHYTRDVIRRYRIVRTRITKNEQNFKAHCARVQ